MVCCGGASCRIRRRRRCAPCCARASNWFASSRATCCACKRRWRAPTSNWIRCSPGKSGRAMLEALIAGETNPTKLASLADRRVKGSQDELREGLRGRVTKQHRFLLRLHLNHIDALEATVATIDAQVEESLAPFRAAVELITSIPGIKSLGAHVIVSEIGIDMSRFPSAGHLISWACLCPRNDESAGKRRSNRVRKGAVWLKTTLVQCAWAAVKKKDSYLQAQFFRIRARRGNKKAISRSQLRCSPPSITGSRMERYTRTSAAIT